jgi:hypothetical protein
MRLSGARLSYAIRYFGSFASRPGPGRRLRSPVRDSSDSGACATIQVAPANLRRGHYELGVEVAPAFRLATAFDELRIAI